LNYLNIFYKKITKIRYFYHNKLKIFIVTFLLVIASMTFINLMVGKIFYQNISPSAPPGLYMISLNQKLSYGDFVIVSLPINVPSLNVEKGFPLLKKVQGFPGDSYFVDSHGLFIHERMYKNIPAR